LIERIKENENHTNIDTNIKLPNVSPVSSDEPDEQSNDDFASVIRDGVEVVDVRIIPKDEINKKQTVDKFGIPDSGRRNWDKI